MSLSRIAAHLDSTRISSLEEIAQSVRALNQNEFDSVFARLILNEKLSYSGLAHERYNDRFPYIINESTGMLVMVSPRGFLPDQRKNGIMRFAKTVSDTLDGHEGIIAFAPYLMNGRTFRENMKKELPIEFVNLPYDAKALERRFRQYCR